MTVIYFALGDLVIAEDPSERGSRIAPMASGIAIARRTLASRHAVCHRLAGQLGAWCVRGPSPFSLFLAFWHIHYRILCHDLSSFREAGPKKPCSTVLFFLSRPTTTNWYYGTTDKNVQLVLAVAR